MTQNPFTIIFVHVRRQKYMHLIMCSAATTGAPPDLDMDI